MRIVDARSPAEYEGKDRRAKRGGHIPGAINIEWKQNLRPDWTFKSLDDLRAMYVYWRQFAWSPYHSLTARP